MGSMAMQLLRFSRVLTGTLLLAASDLSPASFPALGQPTIQIPDGTGGTRFGDVKFINFDERITINSECTRQPNAIGKEIDQNSVSISRDIFPRGPSQRKSPQSAVMDWVATYLHISREYDLPCIAYAPTNTIAVVRHRNSHSKHLAQDMGAYDDAVNTIYLPEGWTGKTSAEASMLVHQMVYHLQKLAGLKYECSWERERLAYAAQEQWLRLHESNLWASFGIDRTIFLLSAEYIC
jgi:hypothetical protein